MRTRAAISVDGRSKKAHFTHLLEDLGVECLVSSKVRIHKVRSHKSQNSQKSEVTKVRSHKSQKSLKSEVTKSEVAKTDS